MKSRSDAQKAANAYDAIGKCEAAMAVVQRALAKPPRISTHIVLVIESSYGANEQISSGQLGEAARAKMVKACLRIREEELTLKIGEHRRQLVQLGFDPESRA